MQFLEVSTLQGPEMQIDVSELQRSVLLLEVSATGPELYLDVSALQRSVLLLEVSATGPALHLDMSALVMSTIPKRKQKRSDIEANYRNETKTF